MRREISSSDNHGADAVNPLASDIQSSSVVSAEASHGSFIDLLLNRWANLSAARKKMIWGAFLVLSTLFLLATIAVLVILFPPLGVAAAIHSLAWLATLSAGILANLSYVIAATAFTGILSALGFVASTIALTRLFRSIKARTLSSTPQAPSRQEAAVNVLSEVDAGPRGASRSVRTSTPSARLAKRSDPRSPAMVALQQQNAVNEILRDLALSKDLPALEGYDCVAQVYKEELYSCDNGAVLQGSLMVEINEIAGGGGARDLRVLSSDELRLKLNDASPEDEFSLYTPATGFRNWEEAEGASIYVLVVIKKEGGAYEPHLVTALDYISNRPIYDQSKAACLLEASAASSHRQQQRPATRVSSAAKAIRALAAPHSGSLSARKTIRALTTDEATSQAAEATTSEAEALLAVRWKPGSTSV